jgi:hypothetical protein
MENKKMKKRRKIKEHRNKVGEKAVDRFNAWYGECHLRFARGSRFIALSFGYVTVSRNRNSTQFSVTLTLKKEAAGSCETLVVLLLLGTELYCLFTIDRNVHTVPKPENLVDLARC